MMRYDFLLIGSWSPEYRDRGARVFQDLNSAFTNIKDLSFNVVCVTITSVLDSRFHEFYRYFEEQPLPPQWIVAVPPQYPPFKLLELHRIYKFCRIIDTSQESQVPNHLFEGLKKSLEINQAKELQKLSLEQTQRLSSLQIDLENRIEKRTKALSEIRQRLFNTNQHLQDLQQCLIAGLAAMNFEQLEQRIQEILSKSQQIDWLQIHEEVTPDHTFKNFQKEKGSMTVYRSLLHDGNEPGGEIIFFRGHKTAFSKEEKNFLTRIAEAISPLFFRIKKGTQLKLLNAQWDVTLRSISDPVVIVSENYSLLKSNKHNIEDGKKIKCFELLFSRSSPCPDCHLGQDFRLTLPATNSSIKVVSSENWRSPKSKSATVFEVASHPLHKFKNNTNSTHKVNHYKTYANVYRDISEKLELEQRILENAKLAELGIIGSSIAHELNNPLAGMLSYAQILLMDLPKGHPLREEIIQIELGIKKSRDIIEDLLSFARDPQNQNIVEIDPNSICLKAKSILDIRAKPLGVSIEIENQLPAEFRFLGNANLLLQAISQILQLSWESICSRDSHIPLPNSWIKLKLSFTENPTDWMIVISDNGQDSLARQIGLSIPIASQIFRDHGGSLETGVTNQRQNFASIRLPRPVFNLKKESES